MHKYLLEQSLPDLFYPVGVGGEVPYPEKLEFSCVTCDDHRHLKESASSTFTH